MRKKIILMLLKTLRDFPNQIGDDQFFWLGRLADKHCQLFPYTALLKAVLIQ